MLPCRHSGAVCRRAPVQCRTLGFFEGPEDFIQDNLSSGRSRDTAVTMCQPLFFLLSPSTSLGPLPSPQNTYPWHLLFSSLEPSHIQVVQPDPHHSLLIPQPLRRKVEGFEVLGHSTSSSTPPTSILTKRQIRNQPKRRSNKK